MNWFTKQLILSLVLLIVGCGSDSSNEIPFPTGACFIVSPNRDSGLIGICFGPVYEWECNGVEMFFQPGMSCDEPETYEDEKGEDNGQEDHDDGRYRRL